ncbi:MAG: DUF433 domain-containing protein [Janthinobacterium lividum]
MIVRYIVSNPHICHGKPTFRGTRFSSRRYWNRSQQGWLGKRFLTSGAAMCRKRPLLRRCGLRTK